MRVGVPRVGLRALGLRHFERSGELDLADRRAGKVALDQYLGMNCEALKVEKTKITSRQSELGPTLIPVVDEHKREQELSELSGELKAVDEATAKNNCRTGTTTSSSIVKKQVPVPKPGTLDSLR